MPDMQTNQIAASQGEESESFNAYGMLLGGLFFIFLIGGTVLIIDRWRRKKK